MYFDRFDICEAYYIFLSEYHEGQGSEKYARLCKLLLYFKPSRMFRASTMSLNAYEIYCSLVAKEQSKDS
jgi:hypothetical protein